MNIKLVSPYMFLDLFMMKLSIPLEINFNHSFNLSLKHIQGLATWT